MSGCGSNNYPTISSWPEVGTALGAVEKMPSSKVQRRTPYSYQVTLSKTMGGLVSPSWIPNLTQMKQSTHSSPRSELPPDVPPVTPNLLVPPYRMGFGIFGRIFVARRSEHKEISARIRPRYSG